MAIYFVPAKQLSHHQSFCLKEYIAIKSRKYAFTLAKSATQFPPTVAIQLPFPHCPLCPSVSPPLLFPLLALSLCLYLWDTTLGQRRGGNAHCILAAAKTFGCLGWGGCLDCLDCLHCSPRLLLLMFYYPQQIKIASFCPAQCKSCLVMPTSEAGVQFNARHSINCPAEGSIGALMKWLSHSRSQSPFTATDWRWRRAEILCSQSKNEELMRHLNGALMSNLKCA